MQIPTSKVYFLKPDNIQIGKAQCFDRFFAYEYSISHDIFARKLFMPVSSSISV